MLRIRHFCTNCLTLSRRTLQTYNRPSYSTKTQKNERDLIDDGPVKYSQSAASTYRAQTTRTGISEPRLWYEPYVILASLTVFMLYFTVIREENDIDEELGRSLYSRISGLEEHQLRLSLEFNQNRGKDTTDIVQRLKEIEEDKVNPQVSE